MDNKDLEYMLSVNKEQKKYYESKEDLSLEDKGNTFTKIWRKARRAQQDLRTAIGMDDDLYNLHRDWLQQFKGKEVLDLGCFAGNPLSLEIAESSSYYLGLDLSETALQKLDEKLKANKIQNAEVMSADFLSESFQNEHKGKFSLIYAYSVMHHFKYFDEFLKCCRNVLAEDGRIIAFDPLETYLPMYLLRRMYRPFQSDRHWEYPFNRKTIKEIKKYFDIEAMQGIMGKTKRAIPLYYLNRKAGEKLGNKIYQEERGRLNEESRDLYNCLKVTLLLKKKEM